MNWMSLKRVAALLGLAISFPMAATLPSMASEFTETAIDQSQVIAVAVPYGVETRKYNLFVFEQIPSKRQCWQVSGNGPMMVDALLTQFDFTGHCRRATDSNGYSLRMDGQDFGLDYLLRIVPRRNELVLVATSRTGRGPEIILGRTQGMSLDDQRFMQIQLNPGWQFTKRSYQGKVLGHYYISGSRANLVQAGMSTEPAPVAPDSVQPPLTEASNETPPSPDLLPEPPDETPMPAESNASPASGSGTELIFSPASETEVNDVNGAIAEEEEVEEEEKAEAEVESVTSSPATMETPRRGSPTPADFRRTY